MRRGAPPPSPASRIALAPVVPRTRAPPRRNTLSVSAAAAAVPGSASPAAAVSGSATRDPELEDVPGTPRIKFDPLGFERWAWRGQEVHYVAVRGGRRRVGGSREPGGRFLFFSPASLLRLINEPAPCLEGMPSSP